MDLNGHSFISILFIIACIEWTWTVHTFVMHILVLWIVFIAIYFPHRTRSWAGGPEYHKWIVGLNLPVSKWSTMSKYLITNVKPEATCSHHIVILTAAPSIRCSSFFHFICPNCLVLTTRWSTLHPRSNWVRNVNAVSPLKLDYVLFFRHLSWLCSNFSSHHRLPSLQNYNSELCYRRHWCVRI